MGQAVSSFLDSNLSYRLRPVDEHVGQDDLGRLA